MFESNNVLFLIIFVVGVGGNFLVCYSVWRSQTLHNVTNYFLVNLSVSDLMVMLICMPGTLTHDVTKSRFFGLAMCKAFVYMQVRSPNLRTQYNPACILYC